MGLQSEVLENSTGTLSDAELAAVELFKGYPDGLMIFATTACVILMLVGIPGNIATIVALARYKKVRNATAIFIMNLSFSDLLFCCFNVPFTASTFSHRAWVHGQYLCRMFPLIRYLLIGNSLFTILAITINRYIMIAHPKLYTKLYKKRNIIIMLLCTWIFPFGIVIPIVLEKYGRFGLDVSSGSCSIISDYKNNCPKKVIILGSFTLSCIVIILCYARIFCIVRKTTKNSLNAIKRVPNQEESSSADLSTSVSIRITGETSCNYSAERINSTRLVLTRNTNTTGCSTNKKMSDNFIRQPETLVKEPLSLHRTTLKKSIKLPKMALPTRKDRRLGSMIMAIFIAFCLCYLPITISRVFLERNQHPALKIAAHILYILSSSINPIIYVVMSNEYRKAYKNLFKGL